MSNPDGGDGGCDKHGYFDTQGDHVESSGIGRVSLPEGVLVEAHEKESAVRLARAGHDVRFRAIDFKPGAKNPDLEIDGRVWELKGAIGSGKDTIAKQFRRARRQASRLVIDLARCGLPDSEAIAQAKRRFFRDCSTLGTHDHRQVRCRVSPHQVS